MEVYNSSNSLLLCFNLLQSPAIIDTRVEASWPHATSIIWVTFDWTAMLLRDEVVTTTNYYEANVNTVLSLRFLRLYQQLFYVSWLEMGISYISSWINAVACCYTEIYHKVVFFITRLRTFTFHFVQCHMWICICGIIHLYACMI